MIGSASRFLELINHCRFHTLLYQSKWHQIDVGLTYDIFMGSIPGCFGDLLLLLTMFGFFNETGYLIPLVKTVGANQQGEGAIAPEPCWFSTNCLNKGYQVPCFILTRYLMNVLTNQEADFMSPFWFSIKSKYPCWKFLSSVPVDCVELELTGYLFSQWKSLLLIKYLVICKIL